PVDPSQPALTVVPTHVPKVGQTIRYEGTHNGNVYTEEYKIESYNSAYSDWTVSSKITDGYSVTIDSDYYATLWSTEKHNSQLKTCVADGGKLEIVTVKSGTFQTCVLVKNGYRIWRGPTPFWGEVKVEKLDGSLKIEVTQFTL
ncbi:MAG: hypothetical protein V4736_05575, partial [Bdellovibrionota bacterium]